jgi:DnaJ like chaperone protein
MPRYEKWLGAGLGFVVTGNPVGAYMGYVAGSALESDSKTSNKGLSITEFETNILVLAAEVIKADGKASAVELDFVRTFFDTHFDTAHRVERSKVLYHCIQRGYDPRKACQDLRTTASTSTRRQLLQFLFELAAADTISSDKEISLLFKIAGWLNINDVEFKKIRKEINTVNKIDYTLLQVQPNASWDEIKAAYRRLVLEFHPDKNAQLSKAAQEEMAHKFMQLQAAFDRIKQERGM